MKRVTLIAVLTTFVVGACGGGAKTFTAADLERILLKASDAPTGTEFVQDQSGPQKVEDVASDDTEAQKLKEFGFLAAHSASFATPGLFQSENIDTIPPNSRLFAVLGVVFRDAANAQKALEFERTYSLKDAKDLRSVASGGLGEKGYALSFSALDSETPLPGFALLWRRGNALFAFLGAGRAGATTASELLSLAKKMDLRTT